jgi:protein ImuB
MICRKGPVPHPRLWLALRFPSLPLEIFARGMLSPGLLAVAAATGAHAEIVACNHEAHRRGVRAGMPAAAAAALAADLHVLTRDPAAERAALERIAACAIQFTPMVSITPSAEVLLEIAGSLKLFGGLSRLWARIEQELDTHGYAVCIACAPTPLAAQFFARAGLPVRIQHRDALRSSLAQLSVDVLDLPQECHALLHDIGTTTIGACLTLPRAGLARRLSQVLLDRLDRALGHIPDPRPSFVPPVHFTTSLQLPAPVEEAAALVFAARRLLAELTGFLAATGKGAQRLRFMLAHEGRDDTRFELNLAMATRDLEHLTIVLRERLERLALPSPVNAIALESELLLPLASRNLTFLPDAREQAETDARLIARLRARLGDDAVKGLATVADYRPEYAWRTGDPGAEAKGMPSPPLSRPLWLLHTPRPLGEIAAIPQYEGPLALLAGPERIESGWWDGNDIGRDYFVARNPALSLLWIYRERRESGRWYLHGFFS